MTEQATTAWEPAAQFEWHGPPRIPRTASTQIREALVPMVMWTSVPVTRRVDQDLTIVDRFVLEAALALSPMRAEDVEEVTQIPRDAVLRIAGRLASLGLLRRGDTGFYAVADAASEALKARTVPRYTKAFLTFVYLPDGDDLIAFTPGPGQTAAPKVDRAEPVTTRLLPTAAADRPLAEFIAERIRSGTVTQLPADIVDAQQDPRTVPPACSVYRCSGHVGSSGEDVKLILDLRITSGKKERCSIPGAVGQARAWEKIAARAPEVAADWGGVVVAIRESPTRWRFTLDREAAAAAIAKGAAVSRPAGLSIAEPPSCVAEVEVVFEPAGTDAAAVFGLDMAVRQLTDTPHTQLVTEAAATAADEARQHFELADTSLTTADVEHRLWDEAYFRHIYALREQLDFSYD